MATRADKPQIQTHVLIEGKIVGAVMRDKVGYFYRPKRNSITVGPWSSKWDGDRYPTQKECERTL